MSNSKAVVEGFAGGVGSLIALVATYPLKTIYTLQALEVKRREELENRLPTSAYSVKPHPVLRLISALKRVNVAGLYAGLKPAAVETVTSTVVYFYLYSLLKQAVTGYQRRRRKSSGDSLSTTDLGVLASLVIASLAGAGNMLVTTPASVLTTQMQALSKRRAELAAAGKPHEQIKTSSLAVAQQVYSEGGVSGFWRGLVPSLILVVNPAVQYMLYELFIARAVRLKEKKLRKTGQQTARVKLGAGEVFLLGALAKIGATVVTYPMIVVKARLQAMNEMDEEMQYHGTADAIARIYQEEGLGGYFKGARAKMLQTALNAALMLTIKDQVYQSSAVALQALQNLSQSQGHAAKAMVMK